MKILLRFLLHGGLLMALLALIGTAITEELGHDIMTPKALFASHTLTVHLLEDRSMGMEDAPVTVIEYSSLTCPHCAEFHTQILPHFKTRYIDSGKVKFIYRDFPIDPIATAAAMLARCAQPDMYFNFLDALFSSQKTWSRANKPRQVLVTLARLGGMTETDVNQCLDNADLLAGLATMKNEAISTHGIKATPSFVIGGRSHVGVASYDALAALVEAELHKE